MATEPSKPGTALVTRPTDGVALEAATFNMKPLEYIALRDAIAREATPEEFKVHLMIAARLGLSPVGGHVHFVKRWDNQLKKPVFATQIGIDGYRSLAEATGKYEGPAGLPQYQMEKGGEWTEDLDVDAVPYAAKVGVYRKGVREPIYAVAYYKHYVQTASDGQGGKRPNAIWNQRPGPQLAKCAEALALRQGFPRELGGIYTIEEMAQANADITIDAVATPVPEETKPKAQYTDPQRKVLWALGQSLPTPGETRGGPTRWAPGKYAARLNETGAFECVLSEIVADHVMAHGDGCNDVKQMAETFRALIHVGPHTPGHVDAPPPFTEAPEGASKPVEGATNGGSSTSKAPETVNSGVDAGTTDQVADAANVHPAPAPVAPVAPVAPEGASTTPEPKQETLV